MISTTLDTYATMTL